MSVTFYVCDPARRDILEKLVDEMEAEDPLEDVEDSAYDRFAAELEAHHLESNPLSEEASVPAEAFYEWFHEQVSADLDKLYLTSEEARAAMATLERKGQKKGIDELAAGFWHASEYPRETAVAYLHAVVESLRKAIDRNGLMVICYR